MVNPKFFRFPFGATGDKTPLPDEVQQTGNVSYAEGWGMDYERNPTDDAQAKRIERDKMNQLHHDITSNIQQYQLYGTPYFYSKNDNGGQPVAYAKGAQVRYDDGSGEKTYISKINANTNPPTDSNSWLLFDPSIKTPLKQLNTPAFVPVVSMSESTPPTTAEIGNTYLVAANATGEWANKVGQIAEWNGQVWTFTPTPNGHTIGLPNGEIYTKCDNQYRLQIALDSQSGKWVYAETMPVLNDLTNNTDLSIILNPQPALLTPGMSLYIKVYGGNYGNTNLIIDGFDEQSIIYQQTGDPLVGGDFNLGDIIHLIYDGINWQLQPTLAYLDRRYSKLTEPPSNTFYVIGPTGNDRNSGLSSTTSQGFATIQGAINAISSRYITTGTVTLKVSAGTYDGFQVVASFVSNWVITGNRSNPGTVRVIATDKTKKLVRGCVTYNGTNVRLEGMTFSGYFEAISTNDANIDIYDCNIVLGGNTSSTGVSCYGGRITIYGKMTVTGYGSAVFVSDIGGIMRFGYNDELTATWTYITYQGVTCTWANMASQNSSSLSITTSVTRFYGVPNGPSYVAAMNGVIVTWGAGANVIPGTSAGTVNTGGLIT